MNSLGDDGRGKGGTVGEFVSHDSRHGQGNTKVYP